MSQELLVVDSLHGLARTQPLGHVAVDRPIPDTAEALVGRLAIWEADFVAGQASATVRAVRADWAQYIGWCEGTRQSPFPAPVEQLEAFIRNAIVLGRKRSTALRYVYTVGLLHAAAGLPNPTKDPRWKPKWKALQKELRSRGNITSKQAGALVQDDVRKIISALGTSLHDLRDAALLALASDTLLRESELVAVRVEHFRYNRAKASWSLYVPFSKANQDGQQADFRFVDRSTRERVEAWMAACSISTGFVFLPIGGRPKASGQDGEIPPLLSSDPSAPAHSEEPLPLGAQEVARIFRRRARAAGLDHALTISGHSARIGTANDLINAGKTTAQIQDAGGWRSAEMVNLYTRQSQAGVNAVAELRSEAPALHPVDGALAGGTNK